MIEDPHLRIKPYNPEYSKIFEEIKRFIRQIIPYKIEIEHVGSTAVPGLGGREIIDVLLVADKENLEGIAYLLKNEGFRLNPQNVSEERIFVSGPFNYKGKEMHVHFHITFSGSNEHKEILLFRDYLKKHPDEARKYYELKKKWMQKAKTNAKKYAEFKEPFIQKILEKAREEEN